MIKDAPDFSVGTLGLSPIAINTIPILKNYPGGNVFYFDNFEGSNITWEIVKEQGASYCFAEIDKTQAYFGAGCARLYRNENQTVSIRLGRHFQFRSTDMIGVEFSFMLSDKSGVSVVFMYEYIIDNKHYRFLISFEEPYIRVFIPGGYFTYYYGPNNSPWYMVWNNVKVILNIKDHRYVRLYYGKDVYNIDHPAETPSDASGESPYLRLCCFFPYGGVVTKSVWIDKVILTDDETI